MLPLVWLVPAVPFASSLALILAGPRLRRRTVAFLGAGSIGLSALFAFLVAAGFTASPPAGSAYLQVLWTWMDVAGFEPRVAFYLDPLSLLMMLVVTFVSFLIHLYSVEYMAGDEGYSRFFAYMNLFVGAMLVLVLADNLLLLYLGWEGVGLCSYLLIGFWYTEPANGRAARKAFIVTRVGDTAMAIGLFLIFQSLGTLYIPEVMARAQQSWPAGSVTAAAAAALLLGGALGKSAQLPLQTWLPDAMAGPTPTSALIHAATMVTAGVYLIARTHALFELAPRVQAAVAVIGAATLLVAGFSALTQSDIKRVLAYSTISQIGYMFLALGAGAWTAAMFHFMTHAFFKALLFMAAGAVILALHHEQNIFRMGGLRTRLPAAYWSFLIGGSALAGLPLITAGFYSKDMILWQTWSSEKGGAALWAAGLAGVLLTSLYTFRQIFLVFFGEAKTEAHGRPGLAITVPLAVLAVLSIAGGWIPAPKLLRPVFPAASEPHQAGAMTEVTAGIAAGLAFAAGLALAYLFFLRRPAYVESAAQTPAVRTVHQWWFSGWGFDWLYDTFLVQPFVHMAYGNRRDFIDRFYDGVADLNRRLYRGLSLTETGRLRWYAAGIAAGSAAFVLIVMLS